MLRYGAFSMGTGLVALMIVNFDKLAVGAVLGSPVLVGAYYVAFSYGMTVPNLFTGVVTTVMFPTFSKMRNDLTMLRSKYLKALKYLSYISIPTGVGLAVVSKPFVLSVLGSEWSDAVVPLAILSVFGILSSLSVPAGCVFLATGNPHRMFRQTWAMAVPFFVFLIPAVYYWKLVGVAILFVLIGLVSTIWVFRMVADILKFSLITELRMLYVPIIASIAMVALSLGVGSLMEVSLLSLVAQTAVGILTYVVCIYLLTKGEVVKEVKDLLASARLRVPPSD
jgi:PST family polysaccharide transporter/lipopolysaccharide exporter